MVQYLRKLMSQFHNASRYFVRQTESQETVYIALEMKSEAKSDQSLRHMSSSQQVARVVVASLVILIAWLLLLGSPTVTILRFSIVLLLQGLLGWRLLEKVFLEAHLCSSAQVGLSLAVGTALCAALDQVTQPFLTSNGWRNGITLLLALALTEACRSLTQQDMPPQTAATGKSAVLASGSSETLLPFLLALALIGGRGDLVPGRGTATVALLLGAVIFMNSRIQALRYSPIAALAWVLGSIGIAAFLRPDQPYNAWSMEPLYHGTDDLVFSEAMSYSLSTFGSQQHIAAFGTTLRYHWFSFAWAGMLGRMSEAEPFVTTLHLVPTTGYLMIVLLLIGFVRRHSQQVFAPLVASLLLFFGSYPGIRSRFIVAENTSNIIGHVWLMATALFLLSLPRTSGPLIRLVTIGLLTSTFFTKPHYAVVLVIWLGVRLLFAVYKRVGVRESLLMLVAATSSLVICYLALLRPHAWEQRSLVLAPHWLGIPTEGRLGLLAPAVSVAVVGSMLAGCLGVLLLRRREPLSPLVALSSAVLGGGLLSLLITGNSSEEYVLGASLPLGAGLMSISLAETVAQQRMQWTLVLCVSVLSLGATYWCLDYWLTFEEFTTHQLGRSSGLPHSTRFIVPWVLTSIALALAVVILAVKNRTKSAAPVHLGWIRASAVTLAVFVGSQIGAYVSQSTYGPPQKSFALVEDLQALAWIRTHSSDDWFLATNRDLCIDPPNCEASGSSFLISATTRQPVLIEGPRFVVGGQILPTWLDERRSASLNFAQGPSPDTLRVLRDLGVTHFYLDGDSYPGMPDHIALTAVGKIIYDLDNRVILQLAL